MFNSWVAWVFSGVHKVASYSAADQSLNWATSRSKENSLEWVQEATQVHSSLRRMMLLCCSIYVCSNFFQIGWCWLPLRLAWLEMSQIQPYRILFLNAQCKCLQKFSLKNGMSLQYHSKLFICSCLDTICSVSEQIFYFTK